MINAQVRWMLSRRRGCSARSQRGQSRMLGLRYADQAARLAAYGARGAAAGQRVRAVVMVKPFPHRLAVERAVEPYQEDRQHQQCIDAGAQPDRHKIAELDVGDKDAEHKDLDHRPRAQPFRQGENAAQMARRVPLMGADQHVEHAGEPEERRQHGDEDHDEPQRRHALPDQLLRPGKQIGDMADAGGLDAHQR